MGSYEHSLDECVCLCGKGKFKVSYRVPDKNREGIEHLWDIDCIKCRELYHIEKRGNLIGVIKKAELKSKKILHRPKFIKIIHEINDPK
jgi:hypothetical protein